MPLLLAHNSIESSIYIVRFASGEMADPEEGKGCNRTVEGKEKCGFWGFSNGVGDDEC